MIDTYQPSGNFRFTLIPAFLVAAGCTVGGAYLYQLLLYWIPYIYVLFILTAGFAGFVGAMGIVCIRVGHVRNVLVGTIAAILLSTGGISAKFWFQYQRQLKQEIDAAIEFLPKQTPEREEELRRALREQITFMDHIQLRVERGWALGNGGLPIQGIFVYLIWLIEFGGVLLLASVMTRTTAREPYSEKMQRWATDVKTIMTLPITGDEMVEQIANVNSVDDLLSIPIPKSDESNQFAVYKVNSIPDMELEDVYLSVSELTINFDKQGNEVKSEKTLVTYAILTNTQRDQLFENAELLNEAIAEYQKAKLEGLADQSQEPPQEGASPE